MTTTETIVFASVVGAVATVIATAVATGWDAQRQTCGQDPLVDGARPSHNAGSSWTLLTNAPNNDMAPQSEVYQGPGRSETRTNYNGQIYTKRFHRGGQHNSVVNYEQSCAIQTSTKNPFANGTNNSYARAVLNATQDPTNQATVLVLGPGVAPNNGLALCSC
jgi:hypothetical protein